MVAVALALFAIGAAIWWFAAQRRAAAWFDGDRATWLALAEGVAGGIAARGGDAGVSTGSDRFDGEWDLVTCQMAVIGFAQVAVAYPEAEPRFRGARDLCLDWMVSPDARRFGSAAWGTDGLATLEGAPQHAYLGYLNLALSLDRLVRPDSPHAALNDQLSRSFRAAMGAPVHRFQTYPGETYPPDLATVAASVAVHSRARGEPVPSELIDWMARYKSASVDPATGWIYQSIHPADGAPVYGARGSGTAFTAAWMAYVDPDFSRQLYEAHRREGHRSFLGFGGMREYPPGVFGMGDIDSGPVLFGVGVSATGFGIAGARAHGDRNTHRRLYRSVHLFGLPIRGGRRFATGGGIGNALMFAMLTAPQPQ